MEQLITTVELRVCGGITPLIIILLLFLLSSCSCDYSCGCGQVEADEDYDIHQMGRHEVLVSG